MSGPLRCGIAGAGHAAARMAAAAPRRAGAQCPTATGRVFPDPRFPGDRRGHRRGDGGAAAVARQKPNPEKLSAYECGFEPFEDARGRFDVRFYLVANLFIIFDLEVAFLFPWAVSSAGSAASASGR